MYYSLLTLTSGEMDYIALGSVHLQLQPGQRSVQYNVPIVNDDVTEMDQETFVLNLRTDQDRVATLNGFDSTIVTVMDEDSKLQQACHVCESRMCDFTIQT